jgi:carboxyl-terminal processing protease
MVIVLITFLFWKLPPILALRDPFYQTFSTLIAVRNQIRQHYVEEIDDGALLEGAIQGMMGRLDPFSGYIAPDDFDEFRKRTDGTFSGIGIEVSMEDGFLTVVSPIEDTPAYRAGIMAGDRILAIDGRTTENMPLQDAVKIITGKPGTEVALTVSHPSQVEPRTVDIVRAPINLVSVKGWRRDDDQHWNFMIDEEAKIGYIRISSFVEKTPSEFEAALSQLAEQQARGLILDLRFNPGGLLEGAVEVADCFLKDGLVVYTKNRTDSQEQYSARAQSLDTNIPLAIVINEASASAAEIVAGALQDRGRATVVGMRSYGKGSVQNVIQMEDGASAIRLTTAYYYLPSGRRIHRTPSNRETDEWGIKPDVEIDLSEEARRRIIDARRRVSLPTTTPATSAPADSPPDEKIPSPATGSADGGDPLLEDDDQVRSALELLKKQLEEQTKTPDRSAV